MTAQPDSAGHFGPYGGRYVPEVLMAPIEELEQEAVDGIAPGQGSSLGEDEKLERINKLLDERIRPGLAGDGGGVEVISFDENTLQISYHGACGSCPSSTTGTLRYIEGMLQDEVDPEIRVISY